MFTSLIYAWWNVRISKFIEDYIIFAEFLSQHMSTGKKKKLNYARFQNCFLNVYSSFI